MKQRYCNSTKQLPYWNVDLEEKSGKCVKEKAHKILIILRAHIHSPFGEHKAPPGLLSLELFLLLIELPV